MSESEINYTRARSSQDNSVATENTALVQGMNNNQIIHQNGTHLVVVGHSDTGEISQ